MKHAKNLFLCTMLTGSVVTGAIDASAQVQTTGTPGSPDATTTIPGNQLPPPDPKFGGGAQRGMLAYSALATAYLLTVALCGKWVGVLL